MSKYIHYGCGQIAPKNWTNYDVSPRLRLERMPVVKTFLGFAGEPVYPKNVAYGDIVRGLEVPDNSIDAAFCSHVLEHIDRAGVEKALVNTFRMLKSGGIFRLVVPDLEWRAKRYVEQVVSGDAAAADRFIRSAYIGQERRASTMFDRLRLGWGNSGHRWMYDFHAMSEMLNQAGFVKVRKAELGDSEVEAFSTVEREDRFFDEGFHELAIEAVKP